MMIRIWLIYLCLLAATPALRAEGDPHSLRLMGVCLEGPVDSLRPQLRETGFAEWGGSDDGEDFYFRGKFYGIRAKLLVSAPVATGLLSSAYVEVGPYSTRQMLERNLQYFLYKLQQEHGEFSRRDDAWVLIDDSGSIKLSVVDNGNGSSDIRVFYMPTSAYYKDAVCRGLRGSVQEVVTENAVAEEQFMHFDANGQVENPDLTSREYDRYGYLRKAVMTEQEGRSVVEYAYDRGYRLTRRTLTNSVAGIRYVNEYTYNNEGDILSENQKVYDETGECVLVINMHNNYLTRDAQGNWTSNSLTLSYWEKGIQSQQTTVLQKRTLSYWE